MKQIVKCLWCKSAHLEYIAERKDGVGVVKCTDCGLFMNSSIPEDPSEYYQEEYYSSTEEEPDMGYAGEYSLTSPAFFLWQSSFISAANRNKKKKEFLEIGSATGSLLEIIKERQPDLNIAGIDISDYAANFSKQKGLKAEVAYIQDYKTSPKKDIIFSSETLEHLDDLRIFFDGVKRNMQKGGVFLFYVPSIVELDARREGKEYIRFKTKMEHLLHFTPDFFQNELPKHFGTNVLVKEIVSSYGPCILGAVTSDEQTITDLQLLFDAMDRETSSRSMSSEMLMNLTLFSLKFGRLKLSERLIKAVISDNKLSMSDKSLIQGLSCYHSGELEKAAVFFTDLYKENPSSTVTLKLLNANQRELSGIYLEEIYRLNRSTEEAAIVVGGNKVYLAKLAARIGSKTRKAIKVMVRK